MQTFDIQESVGQIISPHADPEQATELVQGVVERVAIDLQAGRILVKEAERELMLAPFDADPYQTVGAEVRFLQSLSERRQRSFRNATEFITRSAAQNGIDSLYVDNGDWVRVETKLQGQLAEPCVITTINGKLSISEKFWRGGRWNYTDYDSFESGRGQQLFRGLVATTMWGAHLALTRSADEREAADTDAYSQLVKLHTERRGVYISAYEASAV
jgi:hypothetical protein